MADRRVCVVWEEPEVELWVDSGFRCYILKRRAGGKGTKWHTTYYGSLEHMLQALLKIAYMARLSDSDAKDLGEAISIYREVAEETGAIGQTAKALLAGRRDSKKGAVPVAAEGP